MAFKPNYRQERNARNQAKEQKKQAKQAKREADLARRKGEEQPGVPDEAAATSGVTASTPADEGDAPE